MKLPAPARVLVSSQLEHPAHIGEVVSLTDKDNLYDPIKGWIDVGSAKTPAAVSGTEDAALLLPLADWDPPLGVITTARMLVLLWQEKNLLRGAPAKIAGACFTGTRLESLQPADPKFREAGVTKLFYTYVAMLDLISQEDPS